jgi:hypothetical protein
MQFTDRKHFAGLMFDVLMKGLGKSVNEASAGIEG